MRLRTADPRYLFSRGINIHGTYNPRERQTESTECRLAHDIDVLPNRISAIIHGRRAITADTALRLGKYFGVSSEIWLELQSDYDLRVMRSANWPRIEPRMRTAAA